MHVLSYLLWMLICPYDIHLIQCTVLRIRKIRICEGSKSLMYRSQTLEHGASIFSVDSDPTGLTFPPPSGKIASVGSRVRSSVQTDMEHPSLPQFALYLVSCYVPGKHSTDTDHHGRCTITINH
jgi:hypothetical protein